MRKEWHLNETELVEYEWKLNEEKTGTEWKQLHSKKDGGKIEFRKIIFFPANLKSIFFY